MKQLECISCGALVADIEGTVHRYMDCSPGCWSMFGEVLAREYSDKAFFRNHRLTVDAYALQHPGHPSPQSIQSVAVHLSSLCLIFENGGESAEATSLIKRMTKHKQAFFGLEPPIDFGSMSIRDVWASDGVDAHLVVIKQWAATTWAAWRQHHAQVQSWVKLFS